MISETITFFSFVESSGAEKSNETERKAMLSTKVSKRYREARLINERVEGL